LFLDEKVEPLGTLTLPAHVALLSQQVAYFLVLELVIEGVDAELRGGPQRFGGERAAFLRGA